MSFIILSLFLLSLIFVNKGILISAIIVDLRGGIGGNVYPIFEYTIKNVKYNAKPFFGDYKWSYKLGKTQEIVVSKEKPNKIRVFSLYGLFSFSILSSMLSLIFFVIYFYNNWFNLNYLS